MATLDTNDSNRFVHIPLLTLIGAIVALAGYSAKVNNDLVAVQRDTTRILERMDQRQNLEFQRVHAEHKAQCDDIRRILPKLER